MTDETSDRYGRTARRRRCPGPRQVGPLCHRHPARAWFPNVWDLTGGHVDAAETEQEALRRECREELDVTIGAPGRLIELVEEPGIALSVYLIGAWVGEPRNAATGEHDEIRWFHAAELRAVHLADHRYLTLFNRLL